MRQPARTFTLPGPDTGRPGLSQDPEWFRTAVFYQVLLRAYSDSDGSGAGDLRGLADNLDYLAWLGIDCLWIPPFYPSPLRDGGYDVSDYTSVAAEYGTIEDFADLVEQAHALGIRVLIDVVMNHTSDAHPWFQSSRANPEGPYGDFYVWADDNTGYPDARIIFVDTETSNWTFDPVRRQYFWHRFFSHQPDLNYENPRVREAMLEVTRFWLRTGVDGFRLDAVPYLFEAEGTNGENLPATHDFLAQVRALVDEEFPGRILLAEANQWPHDVVEYFGTPEQPECHMCFHFPVMPRIFYALREQNARAISEILADTPQIPPGAQWGTFLRNHDELTLEMVSTEERAAMYSWYAEDPRMRANVGIRRRLAPLLENSRAEIELAHALLLSLPGSPFLYYGDEIGMGDNIWLPDRDSVRTPMQWNPDRNAGFSRADPGKLYLPTIQSLTNHYGQTNIEAQLAMPTSLLHWVRGMLEVRKAHPVFGNGDYVPLDSDNEAVLAFLRRNSTETMLCVTNLANTPRSATITVPELGGHGLVDVFSGTRFPTLTPVPAQPPGQAPGAAPEVEEESVVRHHTPEYIRHEEDGTQRSDDAVRAQVDGTQRSDDAVQRDDEPGGRADDEPGGHGGPPGGHETAGAHSGNDGPATGLENPAGRRQDGRVTVTMGSRDFFWLQVQEGP